METFADAGPARPHDGSRSELGKFLRSRREKLTPGLVGLAEGRRRRAAGLRREEVAELAGIGVDWYIRLEQGRAVSPSRTTIDALARALRLDKAEHAHLQALAANGSRRPFRPETVPEPLQRVVESLNQPAYITGRRWDILAWNAAAAGVFGFDRGPAGGRSRRVRLRPGARRRPQHPRLHVHQPGDAPVLRRRLGGRGPADDRQFPRHL